MESFDRLLCSKIVILIVTGTSTASDHVSSGISGKNHLHGEVQSGNSKTGVPE